MTADVPKLRELRVRALRVPMPQPHRTAAGVVTESPLVLADAVTDDGTVGHGMVFTYTTAALSATADLIRSCAPMIIGDALAPLEIERKLMGRFRLLGTQGLVGIAIAAIDMALWDALARSRGISLVRLLGGVERPIPAYGGIGYNGPAESARVAEEWVGRGFKGVKAKIGYPTVQEDVAVIRAIRKAVGAGVAIMVDYNQCLTPGEAIERMRVLDDEGLAWVEEPTLAHDFAGHARVAQEARTPVQSGESWWGILDLRNALDAKACDLVMPDVMRIGGVTGWMRAAALAQAYGVRLSSHLWPEISTQLLCLTPTSHWLEYADWWNPVLAEPLRIENGLAVASGVLGTGVSWNEEAVAKFCT
jgi:mandelate racemase